jgi:hypothetical protein
MHSTGRGRYGTRAASASIPAVAGGGRTTIVQIVIHSSFMEGEWPSHARHRCRRGKSGIRAMLNARGTAITGN